MWGSSPGDGELVGRCGFYPYTGDGAQAGGPEPELAFLLARERWGQGLATEAARAVLAALFAMHRPERAIALVDPRHVACRRVLEKIGMRAERRVVVAGAEAVLYATGAPPGAERPQRSTTQRRGGSDLAARSA
jgi:ribosomal-protein-alanine N-acetyltransferase